MKIQKSNINENLATIATQQDIMSVDLRTMRITQIYSTFGFDLKTIENLSEHIVFYGGTQGQVGTVDKRVPHKVMWFNTTVHETQVSDILKISNSVITGDKQGIIAEWVGIQ
jgi:hypothetical protein